MATLGCRLWGYRLAEVYAGLTLRASDRNPRSPALVTIGKPRLLAIVSKLGASGGSSAWPRLRLTFDISLHSASHEIVVYSSMMLPDRWGCCFGSGGYGGRVPPLKGGPCRISAKVSAARRRKIRLRAIERRIRDA